MQDFWAAEATLNTVMLAYNSMSLLLWIKVSWKISVEAFSDIFHIYSNYLIFPISFSLNKAHSKTTVGIGSSDSIHKMWAPGVNWSNQL